MLIPNYMKDFSCIGSKCEENCCVADWRIGVDKDTYHKYKQNRHPVLGKLFREYIVRTDTKTSPRGAEYGFIRQTEEKRCPFLDEEQLCSIQKTLGASWLCKVCAAYPRIVVKMDDTYEVSLTVSCPEAARVILGQTEPIRMTEQKVDPVLAGLSRAEIKRGRGAAALFANDIRSLCIDILQARVYPLDARVILLGEFLAGVDLLIASEQEHLVQSLFGSVRDYISGKADYLPTYTSSYRGDSELKLQILMHSIVNLFRRKASERFKASLRGFNEGLRISDADEISYEYIAKQFQAAYQLDGKRALSEYMNIFENYLVNLCMNTLFPFGYTMDKLFDAYILLALNHSMIKLITIGMAGRPEGVSREDVLQTIQSFSRWTDHAPAALKELHGVIVSKGWNNLSSIAMVVIDE